MALFSRTFEAHQFHADAASDDGSPITCGGMEVCFCGSHSRPHVHGRDEMQFGFSKGYEIATRFLADGDWIVADPLTAHLGPVVVSDADFRKHFKAAA